MDWRYPLSLFDVTINQNIRGFAEDQYTELARQMAELRREHAKILRLLETIMTNQEFQTKVLSELDETTNQLAQADTNMAASLTNISEDLDKLIASGGNGNIPADVLSQLSAKSAALKTVRDSLTAQALVAEQLAKKADDPVPEPPVIPPVIDPGV